MHPLTQIIVAGSCLALVAMGGHALQTLQSPRETVTIEPEPTAMERAEESYCNVVRQVDPTGFSTQMGRGAPECYE